MREKNDVRFSYQSSSLEKIFASTNKTKRKRESKKKKKS